MTASKRRVVIYRDRLLPYSETFIPAQASRLARYCPTYVGTRALPGGQHLEPSTILSASPRRLWQLAYKTGVAVPPAWPSQLMALKPDLIHAHFGSDGGLVLPLARAIGRPLMVTFHGYDATWETPPWSLGMMRRRGDFFRALLLRQRDICLTGADQLIAVSDYIRRQLLQRGAENSHIRVHYIGVDREFFAPDLTQRRQPMVLFVGRLVEKKGVAYLVRAMAAVVRQHTATLTVVGDGPLRSDLETMADRLGVSAHFTGRQTPEQVRQWMNLAQICCGPSIVAKSGDAEGFGMVFAEAQAMGLPVVGFASGGIPEAVCHGETGLLVPEKNVEELARALVTLLADRPLRQRFARAAQARVAKRFDLQTNTRELELLYDRLVERHGLP